jgi:serine/threonine protein kinase
MATGSEPTLPGPSTLVAVAAPDPSAPVLSAGLLGAWRLLRPIGEGGMGVVWLAERADRAFERQAAVKIIRPGFESAAVHERFLLERQTLGALEHPHIARLLDAGSTADGRPYFVMEYVDGVPIDQWCRDRSLGLSERVALFLQVCDAVQYAHGRLVVHRDIKPGNILVDREGQARLLDFGIAKLLPEGDGLVAAGLTSASERLLTPQYAAPEQLMGQPVGTTTDVYALGMLLYALLADALPYSLAGAGPAEMQRLVCDDMPPRPSARSRDVRHARVLRGDLDLITLMALRKEPARRYQTVEQFAADLRRWRDGLPVLAQPDTARYRLRKFAGRNRLALGAAALVALSLVGGIAASLWQAREAGRARDLAEQRYRDVRSLATNMMFEVDGAIATLPGSVHARRLVVSRALEHFDRLSKDLGDDPGLLADVAMGYEKIADIQGSPFEFNLGEGQAALANARRALVLRERAASLSSTPPDEALLAGLARSQMQLGTLVRQAKGSDAEAEVHFARALAQLEKRQADASRGGAWTWPMRTR